ncbi:DUF2267 domain-containing protein [Psychroflexus sediminis]|uniref:Uncharacterized conserved protein, DUF2267 family n=1 Tax=Psychroflexus sediminis TaxID=470826 RepID=A0A1G7VXM7_9FLAO|nr:DUF2267 domain-containing protein [Psychroflexus sediminis]SDG64189.1 Uncharacterized conserved protein, DUF2267 family [Psychroflexus sediminis]
MKNSNLSFDKFAKDANLYIKKLALDLGHPEEKDRTLRLWRAVMHTIRDRIHIGESLQITEPLPMIFKGIYVEGLTFSEKPSLSYDTLEEMKDQVKKHQDMYGEEDFSWSKPTEELVAIVLNSLKDFMSENQLSHIIEQMPKEIKESLKKAV